MHTLLQVINIIVAGFQAHGALHPSIGIVSNHLGWVSTHRWLVKVCRIGTPGCHF